MQQPLADQGHEHRFREDGGRRKERVELWGGGCRPRNGGPVEGDGDEGSEDLQEQELPRTPAAGVAVEFGEGEGGEDGLHDD